MNKLKKPDPVIVLDNTSPEILADAIVEISKSAKALLNSRLTKRAILVLIRDTTNLPMHTIELVLAAASDLSRYVKK